MNNLMRWNLLSIANKRPFCLVFVINLLTMDVLNTKYGGFDTSLPLDINS
jgi:hypothetical protein